MSVQDKVVAVTGASSGVGKAIALVFAERGAKVVGCARGESGKQLESEIVASGGQFDFVQADVTSPADCRRLIDRTIELHGRIDVLINNAGGHTRPSVNAIETLDTQEWDRVVELNLSAAFYCCQRAIHHMTALDGGLILNIASIQAVQVISGMAAYNAAKAGLVHFTNSVAVECAAVGIRANSIILGPAGTPSSAKVTDEMRRFHGVESDSDAPAPYFPLPLQGISKRSIGEALVALAGDDARAITGSTIAIDRAASVGSVYSESLIQALSGRWSSLDDNVAPTD